jgi:hypothetical protein
MRRACDKLRLLHPHRCSMLMLRSARPRRQREHHHHAPAGSTGAGPGDGSKCTLRALAAYPRHTLAHCLPTLLWQETVSAPTLPLQQRVVLPRRVDRAVALERNGSMDLLFIQLLMRTIKVTILLTGICIRETKQQQVTTSPAGRQRRMGGSEPLRSRDRAGEL